MNVVTLKTTHPGDERKPHEELGDAEQTREQDFVLVQLREAVDETTDHRLEHSKLQQTQDATSLPLQFTQRSHRGHRSEPDCRGRV